MLPWTIGWPPTLLGLLVILNGAGYQLDWFQKKGVEPIHGSPGISHLSLGGRSSALKAICRRTGGLH